MKHIKNFQQQNEAKIIKKDTSTTDFNVGTLIQIVDENDKNIGNAKFKRLLKSQYNVEFKGKPYKIDKKDLSINKHGQVQTEFKNLK
jgi:hypothetical protein